MLGIEVGWRGLLDRHQAWELLHLGATRREPVGSALARGTAPFYINFGMSGWTVETLDAMVTAEIEALPAEIRDRLSRVVGLIETFGLERVGMPHVRRIEGRLWEIRAKGRDGIARAFHVTASGRE